jgi:hypothetical protein
MASRFSSPTFVGRAVELGQLDAARARVAAAPNIDGASGPVLPYVRRAR